MDSAVEKQLGQGYEFIDGLKRAIVEKKEDIFGNT